MEMISFLPRGRPDLNMTILYVTLLSRSMGSPDHELSLDDCFPLLPKQEISAAVVRVTPDDFSSSFFFNMRWMYVSRALEKNLVAGWAGAAWGKNCFRQ